MDLSGPHGFFGGKDDKKKKKTAELITKDVRVFAFENCETPECL